MRGISRKAVKDTLKECKVACETNGSVKYVSPDGRRCAIVSTVDWGRKLFRSTTATLVQAIKGFRGYEPGDVVQIDPNGQFVEE